MATMKAVRSSATARQSERFLSRVGLRVAVAGLLRHRHDGSNRPQPSRQHVQRRRTNAENGPSDIPVDIRHLSRSCIVNACRSITRAACSSSSPENWWAEKSQVPTASATTLARSGLISMRLSED